MKQAVVAQHKVCNAAVRQKTSKRKIAKQFGGECLTEEECIKRLSEAVERKKSKQSKETIPAQVSKKKIRKAKKSNKSTTETSRPRSTLSETDDSVSSQDISDRAIPNDVEPSYKIDKIATNFYLWCQPLGQLVDHPSRQLAYKTYITYCKTN